MSADWFMARVMGAEMKEARLLGIIEQANLFTLVEKEKRLYKFRLLSGD